MLVMNAIISHRNKTAGNVGPHHNVTLPTHTRCEGDNLSFIFTAELAHCVAPCCFVVRLFFFRVGSDRRRDGGEVRTLATRQRNKQKKPRHRKQQGKVGQWGVAPAP